MSPRQRPMRFAHSEGHTDVCFAADGKHIITCGADGDVRIWAGIEDDDNVTICVAEEKAITVAHKEGHLYVGTEDNIVQAYTFPDNKRDGIVTRFTAPVTHISISSSGTYLASGSCDMEVRVADMKTSNNITLLGHSAPILGVAIDPKEKYVVSSSCDGTIRVWDLESRRSVKQWDCVPKCNSFFTATVLARASWQPTNRHYLAIPQERELRLYEPETWSQVVIFSSPGSPQPFSLTAFSPCGNYLAAVAGGDICVWDVNLHSQLECLKRESDHTITALVWNPKVRGELAYCDVRGQLGTIEDCLPTDGKVIPRPLPTTEKKNEVNSDDILNRFDEGDSFAFGGDDDDDDENVISIDKIKSQTLGLDKDNDEDMDDAKSVVSHKSTGYQLSVNAQPPFQPSSTPVSLQNRYMVWNSVGIVRCFTSQGENSIDVRFHDSAVHHNLHISNIFGHTIAALSRQALVMACPAADDSPSKVVCVLLNTWDDTKEWSVSLPDEENAIGIGVGTDWFAVATSTRNLRIFGLAGTQRQIVSLPGPVVCLSGMSEKLMVVFHAGVGLPNEQCLAYQLFTITKESQITSSLTQLLPITPESTLKWIGFSDEVTPFTLDSADMLRMLPRRSAHWMPICNTHEYCKGVSDHYFIIGVSEQYQNIRAVLCRGAHYPPTSPLPVVNELAFKIPLCEMESEKSKMEESLSRAILLLSSMKAALQSCKDEDLYLVAQESLKDAEKIQNETLMKLFALSARSGLEVRAVELCNLMPTVHLTELAAKYSSKLGRLTLVDRVGKVLTAKREKEELERPNSPDMFASQISRHSYNRYSSNNENIDPHENAAAAGQADVRDPSETENLLLAVKRKREALESEVVIRPTLMTPIEKKKSNPFKKSDSSHGLISGLNSISSNKPEVKKKAVSALPSAAVKKKSPVTTSNLPKSRQMNLFGKRVDNDSVKATKSTKDDVTKPPPFMQWFSQNKEELEEEFPELDTAELTKVAMKRYREIGSKSKSTNNTPFDKSTEDVSQMSTEDDSQVSIDEHEESDQPEKEKKKRRIEEEYSEELDLADVVAEMDAQDELEVEEKMEPEEKKEHKKKSGFNKLSAFAFKKPA